MENIAKSTATSATVLDLDATDIKILLNYIESVKMNREARVKNAYAVNFIALVRGAVPPIAHRLFNYSLFFILLAGLAIVAMAQDVDAYVLLPLAGFFLLLFGCLELGLHIDLFLAKIPRPKHLPHLRPAIGNLLHRVAKVVDPGRGQAKGKAKVEEAVTTDGIFHDEVLDDPFAVFKKQALHKQKKIEDQNKAAKANAIIHSKSQGHLTSTDAKRATMKLTQSSSSSSVPPPIKEPAIMATGSDAQEGANTKEQKEKVVGLKPNALKHKRQSMNTSGDWMSSDADFSESEY